MIIRQHDLLTEVHFAQDEQQALMHLADVMYEDEGYIHIPAIAWKRGGADVYRTIKSLARGLKQPKDAKHAPMR